MPKAIPDDQATKKGITTPSTEDASNNSLSSPQLDPETGKPTRQAIGSFKQAHSIGKNLIARAKDNRLKTAGIIADKYNGQAPYDQEELAKSGQDWRNNFSTQFLASIVDRVKPQFLDPVQRADNLTHSTLPPNVERSSEKSRKFRESITKCIRAWPGWLDFLSQLTQEEVVFGNAAPVFLDPEDWRPRIFDYGHCFFPEGTGQHAGKVQVAVYVQETLLHEFMDKLKDKEVAINDAGYDWEGCIAAANEAAGTNQKEGDLNQLEQSDRVREQGVFGASYDSATKTVNQMHVLVREYEGGVHLWTVTKEQGHPIRHVENLHPNMEETLALFTLQTGNGKYYGSKGLGRLLCNIHIAIERFRCAAFDQMSIAGLPIVIGDKAQVEQAVPIVRHPFIFLQGALQIAQEGIKFDAQGFEILDTKLVTLAEAIAGSFIPPNLEGGGSAPTRIEAAQKAEREMAVKQGVLGRFFGQFADLVTGMQRKICSPANVKEALRIYEEKQAKQQKGLKVLLKKLASWMAGVLGKENARTKKMEQQEESMIADNEAVDAIVEMLEAGLEVEDIGLLAHSNAGNNVQESSEERDQQTVAFADANAQNPMYDQKALSDMKAEIALGADRAERIKLKVNDPNVQAKAMRDQIIEIGQMIQGNPMPVASDDNHKIHRQTMIPKVEPIMQLLTKSPTPEMLKAGQLMFDHYMQHLSMDPNTEQGQKAQEEEGMKIWQQDLLQAEKLLNDQAKQAQAAGVNGALPPPVNGQPMGAGADGKMIGDRGERDVTGEAGLILDGKKHDDNIALETERLALQKSQHELDVRKQDHSEQMDVAKLGKETAETLANAATKAKAEGLKDASVDLAAGGAPTN